MFQRACERSRLFVALYVCGFDRLDPERHKPFADFTQRISQMTWGLGLAEDPRGVGKSSISTITGGLQPVIARPVPGTPWRGANTNFVIASKKKERAIQFLAPIRQHWESNSVLHWVTENRVMPDYARKWGSDLACLTRSSRDSDVTYQTVGVDTGQAGPHCDIYLIDDLIDETNWYSPTEIGRARDFVLASSGVVQPRRGSRLITQNQWTLFDVNHWLKHPEEYPPEQRFDGYIEVFSRSLEACVACVGGLPIDPATGRPLEHAHEGTLFPLVRFWPGDETRTPLTMADLIELRKKWGNRMYSAQALNNPLDPAMQKFDERWLQPMQLVVDEAKGRAWVDFLTEEVEEPWHVDVRELYRIAMFDPGHDPKAKGAKRSACVVFGFHEPTGAFLELESWAAKLEPLAAIDRVMETFVRWMPQRQGIDKIGFQRIIGPLLIRLARERYGFGRADTHLPALSAGNEGQFEHRIWLMGSVGDKDARIEGALEPLGRLNRLYVQAGSHQLREEWRRFAMWTYKDIIDCMAFLPRLAAGRHRIAAKEAEEWQRISRVKRARRLATRDPSTGY